MTGLEPLILSIVGGHAGTWLVRWIASKVLGKFGGSILGRIGDAIEKRRQPEPKGRAK